MVSWVVVLLHIQEVLGTILDAEIDSPAEFVCCFSFP
jgi:hypothetical protein